MGEEDYSAIITRAETEGKSKARITAELINYALTDNENEVSQLKREIELKDALIEQLRDENGFVKESFASQTNMAGRLLLLLAEGTRTDAEAASSNGEEDRA
ncbi:MAG: hypothetical protein WBZ42_08615 [Halobacteriota archaeon]